MSCLEPTVVQGYVDGGLAEAERAVAEGHLASCDDCRRLVAALAMTNAGAVTPRRSAPALGASIDRYQLVAHLGQGGMGIVYKAHDPELRRDVAIKLLRAEAAADDNEDLRARLLREAQAMAQVAHPNVIAVYDVGTWQGEVFLAMELATAGTLRAWVKDRPPREVIDAYLAAGRGLAAAHAAGLVHRDFKPDNALVGADGRVRVTDFGLARSHEVPHEPTRERPSSPLATLTLTGAVMGTPAYMAPEIFDGQPADARSDQFAFCVALWEALYQQRPIAGADEATLAENAKAGRIVDPPASRGVPRAVERALRRGLAPSPDARWPSIDALLAELSPRSMRAWWYAGAAALALTGAVAIAAAWPRAHTASVDAGADALAPEVARAVAEIDKLLGDVEHAREVADWATAERVGTEAVARARAIPPALRLVLALADHAQTMAWTDEPERGEKELREARQIAEASGDDPLKAMVSTQLAHTLDRRGKHEEADDIRKLFLATVSRRSSGPSRMFALENDAMVTADVAAARARWDEAMKLRDDGVTSPWALGVVGKLAGRANNRKGLAITLARAGSLEEARGVLLASLQYTEQHGGKTADTAVAELVTHLALAFVELQRGRCADAEAHARESLDLGVRTVSEHEPISAVSERARAQALLCRGDRAAAAAAFEHSLALQQGRPLQQADGLEAIARQELELGDAKDAIRHADAALALLATASHGDPTQPARLHTLLCEALVADHELSRAREAGERAVAAVDATPHPPRVAAAARLALARALPANARELEASAKQLLASSPGPVYAAHIVVWLDYPEPPLR